MFMNENVIFYRRTPRNLTIKDTIERKLVYHGHELQNYKRTLTVSLNSQPLRSSGPLVASVAGVLGPRPPFSLVVCESLCSVVVCSCLGHIAL